MCGTVERVFQPAMSGKYSLIDHRLEPDADLNSSNYCVIVDSSVAAVPRMNWLPGRTIESIWKDPDLPVSVAQYADHVHRSRPGPVVGGSDGSFRNAPLGEYFTNNVLTTADTGFAFRHTDSNLIASASQSCSTNTNATVNMTASSNLLLYYENAGGLNTFLSEYQLAVSDGCYDIYAFTETWLNNNTLNTQLFDDRFIVYRQDRSPLNSCKSTGGGVLLAVRSSYKSQLLYPPNVAHVEQLWVSIGISDDSTLYTCVIYVPPDRVNDIVLIDKHIEVLNWVTLQLRARDNILVLGDFNLSGIVWQRNLHGCFHPNTSQSLICQASRNLLDAYNIASLKQMCGIQNENNRILDLCFVSNEVCTDTLVAQAPLPLVKNNMHHSPLLITLKISPQYNFTSTSETLSYDFKKVNFVSMIDFLVHIDWDDVLRDCDANSAAVTFSAILLYAIDQYAPVKSKLKLVKPAWSNSQLRHLRNLKRSALRRHSKYRTDYTRLAYVVTNRNYKSLNRHLYTIHQNKLQARLKSDPKRFWRHVNEQRKENGLPSTMTDGVYEADSPLKIAHMFRSQFGNIFSSEILDTHEIEAAVSNINPQFTGSGLQFVITTDLIMNAVRDLKCSTASGPDGIPSLILKRCATALVNPLMLIFNLSLSSGIYPKCWKESYVYPVFKKGCKRTASNYRGIAALSATSKLFELIVLRKLMYDYSSYISPDQHGFLPKRSTTTNLVSFVSFVIREVEKGNQVDAIYTDLSAAFDKMNHQIAIAKLEKLGVEHSLLIWLRSYLTGRKMLVKIGDHVSLPFPISSGVPQGSHLGPFLFLLYMNDVNLTLNCPTLSYADDLKLYRVIKEKQDAFLLQQQLEAFATWCITNKMSLNISKCTVISLGRKQSPIHYTYTLDGIGLKRESTVNDLGVLIDEKVTFKDHTAYVVSKASRQLGFIFRFAKGFKDIYCLKALYCALVRPTLEYSSVVWSPYYQNENLRIEAIQRKFIRFALRYLPWTDPFNLPSYESRCKLIDLELLEARRNVAKACFVGDLLQSNIDCPFLLSRLDINTRSRNLRSSAFLTNSLSRTNYGFNEPIRSMCTVFNRCYNVFDFNVSRYKNKCNIKTVLC